MDGKKGADEVKKTVITTQWPKIKCNRLCHIVALLRISQLPLEITNSLCALLNSCLCKRYAGIGLTEIWCFKLKTRF